MQAFFRYAFLLSLLILNGCESVYVACSGGCNDVREFRLSDASPVGSFGDTPPIENLKGPADLLFFGEQLLVLSRSTQDIRAFSARSGDYLGIWGESANLPRARQFVLDSNSRHIYVLQEKGGIRKFDSEGQDLGIFGQSSRLMRAQSLDIHPETGELFVLDRLQCCNQSAIIRFDQDGNYQGYFGVTHSVLRNAGNIAFHPKTQNLFVINSDNGSILRFDGTSGADLGVFVRPGIHSHPWYLDFNKAGDLFVSNLSITEGRKFYQFDGTSGDLVRTFGGGGAAGHVPNAWGFAFGRTSK